MDRTFLVLTVALSLTFIISCSPQSSQIADNSSNQVQEQNFSSNIRYCERDDDCVYDMFAEDDCCPHYQAAINKDGRDRIEKWMSENCNWTEYNAYVDAYNCSSNRSEGYDEEGRSCNLIWLMDVLPDKYVSCYVGYGGIIVRTKTDPNTAYCDNHTCKAKYVPAPQ